MFQLPSITYQYAAVNTGHQRSNRVESRPLRRTKQSNYPLHSTPKRQHRPCSQIRGQLRDLCHDLSSVSQSNCKRDVIEADNSAPRKSGLCIDGDKADAADVSPPWPDSGVDEVELCREEEEKTDTTERLLKFCQQETANITALLAASGSEQCDSPVSTMPMCSVHGNHLKQVISKVVGAILGTDLLCSCISTTTDVFSDENEQSCDNVPKLESMETPVTVERCLPHHMTDDRLHADTSDVSSLQLMDAIKDDSGMRASWCDNVASNSTLKTGVTAVCKYDDIRSRMTATNADDIIASLPVTKPNDNTATATVCGDTNALHTTHATRRTQKRKPSQEKVETHQTTRPRPHPTHLRKSVASSNIRRHVHCNHGEVTVRQNTNVLMEYTTLDRNSHMTKLYKRTLGRRLQAAVHMQSQFTTLVQF